MTFIDTTGPKGNMGTWRHATRLFVDDKFKHSPHLKFLYHVTFFLNDDARKVIPELENFKTEIGMLVKSADLPTFSSNIETKNRYNQKKNIQTKIEYNPIDITFHDDNYGVTTALLEAYYKYYFADGRHDESARGAFGTSETNNPYPASGLNTFNYGLDSGNTKSFFKRIEIAQMTRGHYTRYTLINPIITDWNHDSVDYSDNSGVMENSITLKYESVFYDRGVVNSGGQGDPIGFGEETNYDTEPSLISGQISSFPSQDTALNRGIKSMSEASEEIPESFGQGSSQIPGQNISAINEAIRNQAGNTVSEASGFASTISGAAESVSETVGGLSQTNFPVVDQAGEAISTATSGIQGFANTAGNVIDTASNAVSTASNVASNISGVASAASNIASQADNFGNSISGTLSSASNIANTATNAATRVGEIGETVTDATELPSNISSAASSVGSAAETAGETVSNVTNVARTAQNVAESTGNITDFL